MIADQNEVPSKQGSASSGWLVLDYGSLIVHIMTPQLRNFYKLEKRWKDAELYDFGPFLTELYGVDRNGYSDNKYMGEWGYDSASKSYNGSENEKEEDPFWS